MTLEEARAWLQSSAGQRYLQAVDGDADNAIELANRILPRLSSYSPATVADLRRLATALERAMDAFNAAVNLVVQGRARAVRTSQSDHRDLTRALEEID